MKLKYLKLLPLAAIVAPTLISCGQQKDPTIEEINNLLQTPEKYGIVLQEDGYLVDSPTVFNYNGKWYMTYIAISEETSTSGYESYIAESTDLVNWTNRRKIFSREPETTHWDSAQVAAYMGFVENDLFGDYKLQKVKDKFYLSYLGGSADGYEAGTLSVGEAWCSDPSDITSYHKFSAPILAPTDTDAREGENFTIYKSSMFIDNSKKLGHKYVCFYNAKGIKGDEKSPETIFIAVSDDAEHWHRYYDTSVYKDPEAAITGDAMILKYHQTYIMIYFTLKNGKTCDTFAISKDLIHWTPWTGAPLIESTKDYDAKYAHKPSIVYKDGILYHFYCAVDNNDKRCIALATSKPLK
ncbi:MAG: hypothetical protein KBS35_02615 [Mycoplasma sp.]|nr:hypothetical protein [Candidatus Hennigella equi]